MYTQQQDVIERGTMWIATARCLNAHGIFQICASCCEDPSTFEMLYLLLASLFPKMTPAFIQNTPPILIADTHCMEPGQPYARHFRRKRSLVAARRSCGCGSKENSGSRALARLIHADTLTRRRTLLCHWRRTRKRSRYVRHPFGAK